MMLEFNIPDNARLYALAVRPSSLVASSMQVVIFTDDGCFELEGLDEAAASDDGTLHAILRARPLELTFRDWQGEHFFLPALVSAAYDPFSGATYLGCKCNSYNGPALVCLRSDNFACFVGDRSLEGSRTKVVPDGQGVLYLIQSSDWSTNISKVLSRREDFEVTAAVKQVELHTASCRAAAFDHGRGQLYVASRTAVYSVRGAIITPVAGEEQPQDGQPQQLQPAGDLLAADFRFERISDIFVDASSCLYVCETVRKHNRQVSVQLHKITPEGTLSTVWSEDFEDTTYGFNDVRVAILPHGWLAMYGWRSIKLLQLEVLPSTPQCAASDFATQNARQPRLAVDLGALLRSPPPGAAHDVTVRVGDTDFPAHRILLAARCPFFSALFGSGVGSEATASVVELQDASPATFAWILSYLYEANVEALLDITKAQDMAELSNRLLLPELCVEAQRQVLAAVAPGTVVGALTWAERMGFEGLRDQLVGWYLQNQGKVLEEAGESVERLSEHVGLYGYSIRTEADTMRGSETLDGHPQPCSRAE